MWDPSNMRETFHEAVSGNASQMEGIVAIHVQDLTPVHGTVPHSFP